MAKDWTSPIYGFFKPCPAVEIVDGHCCHKIICVAPHCKGKETRPWLVWQYLNKMDKGSMSNMHKHAKTCWGTEIVSKVLESKMNLPLMRSIKAFQIQTFRMEQLPPSLRERGREMFHSQWNNIPIQKLSQLIYNKSRIILITYYLMQSRVC